MPIFEYECDTCHDRFEELVLSSRSADVHCPKCDGETVHKVYSTFAAQSKDGAGDCAGGFCEPAASPGLCGTCGDPGPCSMN